MFCCKQTMDTHTSLGDVFVTLAGETICRIPRKESETHFETIKLNFEDNLLEKNEEGHWKFELCESIGVQQITAQEAKQFFDAFQGFSNTGHARFSLECWSCIKGNVSKTFLLLCEHLGATLFVKSFDESLSIMINESNPDISFSLALFLWLVADIKRNCGIPLSIKAIYQSMKYFEEMKQVMQKTTAFPPMIMMEIYQQFCAKGLADEGKLCRDVIPFTAKQINTYLSKWTIMEAEQYLESVVDEWNRIHRKNGDPEVHILDFELANKDLHGRTAIPNRAVIKGFEKYQNCFASQVQTLRFQLVMFVQGRVTNHGFDHAISSEYLSSWIGVYYFKNPSKPPLVTKPKLVQHEDDRTDVSKTICILS